MGDGVWDTKNYLSTRALRKASGTSDFAYSETATRVHEALDPHRINHKPMGKLESRDSEEHPNSNAVLLCFDVTGSNIDKARIAQSNLPRLMELLGEYLSDVQVGIAANDDYLVEPTKCIQISDFESDNRVDDWIRSTILVGNGGGNNHESYELLLYAAARKTSLDCFEKRGRKGYLFLYADEKFPSFVSKDQVKAVFGDDIEEDIPVETILAEARQLYHVFLLSTVRPLHGAAEQYKKLFGDHVLILQSPAMICEMVASTVGYNEQTVTPETIAANMVQHGVSDNEANELIEFLSFDRDPSTPTKETGKSKATSN